MGKYKKINEKIWIFAIPILTFIISISLDIFGQRYLRHIFWGIGIIVGMIILVCIGFAFLDSREKRWIENGKRHSSFDHDIQNLKGDFEKTKSDIKGLRKDYDLNAKVNKLENRINLLERKK